MSDFQISFDWVAENFTAGQYWQSRRGPGPNGYVYVLWVRSSAFYKIGFTEGPEQYVHERARHFDACLSNGIESELLMFRPCIFPRLMERSLHREFQDSRTRVSFSSSTEIFYLEPMEFIRLNTIFQDESWLMRQMCLRKHVKKLMTTSAKLAA